MLLICFLLSLLSVNAGQAEELRWHVLHSLTPQLPEDPGDAFLAAYETTPRLSASWGERESLYLYLHSPEKMSESMTLSPRTFVHQSGEIMESASLSLHWCDGSGRAWADGSWPVDLEKDKGMWIRLDWRAPVDAEPGAYFGGVTMRSDGESWDIPFELQVWEFDLPLASPLIRSRAGEAPSLATLFMDSDKPIVARADSVTRGDLPGPGGGALSTRMLPLCAWRVGLRELIVAEGDESFERHFAEGLEDLSYYTLLLDDASLLAERIAALLPVRGLTDWNQDPAKILHWRLAAGSYLAGEEDIALHLVREMEALRDGVRSETRSLFDDQGQAWGWKGAASMDVLDDGSLVLHMDGDRSSARFKPRQRDWRQDGFLELDLELEEEPAAIVELSLEQAGFRKTRWSFRIHLSPKERRRVAVPLPRGELDLGKIHQLELEFLEKAERRTLVLRELRLR